MTKYAVQIKNLTKDFYVNNIKIRALDNLTFNIQKGKVVGLIGSNGSGKSTLLKILSRIYLPTSGSALINGKLYSLLELGAGFNHDLSGIENIYLNCSLYGLSKKKVDLIIDKIIDFSELNDSIKFPLKFYSSGMQARLAFSISVFIESDILFLDEILAVGDISFRNKCLASMNSKLKSGKTTAFLVSHDLDTIINFCDEVIWIDAGKLKMQGSTKEIINKYLSQSLSPDLTQKKNITDSYSKNIRLINKTLYSDNSKLINNIISRSKKLSIKLIINNDTDEINLFPFIQLICNARFKVLSPVVLMSNFSKYTLKNGNNNISLKLSLDFLAPGNYSLTFGVAKFTNNGKILRAFNDESFFDFLLTSDDLTESIVPFSNLPGFVYKDLGWTVI